MKMKAIVFGTCRIHDPVHLIQNASCIDLVDAPLNLYMHTSAEIVQYLEYITGRKKIDQNLAGLVYLPFLNKPVYSKRQPKSIPNHISKAASEYNYHEFKNIDLAIIEISTLRTYRLGDLVLQENCINNYLLEKAGLHIREDQQLRDMFETQPSRRNPKQASDSILNNLLNNCIAEYADEEAIEKDLLKVKEFFRDTIILNHFTSAEMPQSVMDSRNRLQSIIVSVSKRVGMHWFDVSSCIKELPTTEQLSKRDDFNHYSDTAKHHIALQLGRYLVRIKGDRFIQGS
jgi:hypothetical protein